MDDDVVIGSCCCDLVVIQCVVGYLLYVIFGIMYLGVVFQCLNLLVVCYQLVCYFFVDVFVCFQNKYFVVVVYFFFLFVNGCLIVYLWFILNEIVYYC